MGRSEARQRGRNSLPVPLPVQWSFSEVFALQDGDDVVAEVSYINVQTGDSPDADEPLHLTGALSNIEWQNADLTRSKVSEVTIVVLGVQYRFEGAVLTPGSNIIISPGLDPSVRGNFGEFVGAYRFEI